MDTKTKIADKELDRVTVEIFGEKYHLLTDNSEELNELVTILNEIIKKVFDSVRTLDRSHIAILSALKIMEKYYHLKKDYDELLKLISENK